MTKPNLIELKEVQGTAHYGAGGYKFGKAFKYALVERLNSGEMLVDILKQEGMPNESTVYGWLKEDAALSALYELGKPNRALALVEGALADMESMVSKETAYISRARADIKLRVAALFDPARFSTSTHSSYARNTPLSTPVSININIGAEKQQHMGTLTAIDVPVEPKE